LIPKLFKFLMNYSGFVNILVLDSIYRA
jgi:hypothetical protein